MRYLTEYRCVLSLFPNTRPVGLYYTVPRTVYIFLSYVAAHIHRNDLALMHTGQWFLSS